MDLTTLFTSLGLATALVTGGAAASTLPLTADDPAPLVESAAAEAGADAALAHRGRRADARGACYFDRKSLFWKRFSAVFLTKNSQT